MILGGRSPRGDFDHAIVASISNETSEVKFAHDPHYSREWIKDIQTVTFIVPLLPKG